MVGREIEGEREYGVEMDDECAGADGADVLQHFGALGDSFFYGISVQIRIG
jgi:hypothetical protein